MTDIFIWDCGALWQPGIIAPPLHSSKICLIGFHYKASNCMVPGGRREQRSGRIRGGYERQFHFEWYDYSPRSEWDGFHTWQFGGSAHTAYTVFNGWPQAIWAKSVKRLSSWRRQRGGIKPGNSKSREQPSAKWESIVSHRQCGGLGHGKNIYILLWLIVTHKRG